MNSYAGLTNSIFFPSIKAGFGDRAGFLFFGGNMRIKKVINNNILCAIDEKGNELIVTGKGIGFKRFTGELIDQARIEKIYRMEGKADHIRLADTV